MFEFLAVSIFGLMIALWFVCYWWVGKYCTVPSAEQAFLNCSSTSVEEYTPEEVVVIVVPPVI